MELLTPISVFLRALPIVTGQEHARLAGVVIIPALHAVLPILLLLIPVPALSIPPIGAKEGRVAVAIISAAMRGIAIRVTQPVAGILVMPVVIWDREDMPVGDGVRELIAVITPAAVTEDAIRRLVGMIARTVMHAKIGGGVGHFAMEVIVIGSRVIILLQEHVTVDLKPGNTGRIAELCILRLGDIVYVNIKLDYVIN